MESKQAPQNPSEALRRLFDDPSNVTRGQKADALVELVSARALSYIGPLVFAKDTDSRLKALHLTAEEARELFDSREGACPWAVIGLLEKICVSAKHMTETAFRITEAARGVGWYQLLGLTIPGDGEPVLVEMPEPGVCAPLGTQPDLAVLETLRIEPQAIVRSMQPEVMVYHNPAGDAHLTTFALTAANRYPELFAAIFAQWPRLVPATKRALDEVRVELDKLAAHWGFMIPDLLTVPPFATAPEPK